MSGSVDRQRRAGSCRSVVLSVVGTMLLATGSLLTGPAAGLEPGPPPAPPSIDRPAPAAEPAPVLRNGSFDDGSSSWIRSYRRADTAATVVDTGDDNRLEVLAGATEGAVAQDLPTPAKAGHRYTLSIRAESPTGLPVLVEVAIHGLSATGSIGETASRLVMVEGHEVPITATLEPTVDHPTIRAEVYVHTVDRAVWLDDAELLVDRDPGVWNYGYQQPRVRFPDGVDPTRLEPGQRYRAEIAVGTTTDQPWRCCVGTGSVRLGTEDEDGVGGSGIGSPLFVPPDQAGSNWLSPTRIAFDRSESRIGGTFTTVVRAPDEPGPFSQRFRLVAEGVIWLPGPVIEVDGTVVDPPPPADPPPPPLDPPPPPPDPPPPASAGVDDAPPEATDGQPPSDPDRLRAASSEPQPLTEFEPQAGGPCESGPTIIGLVPGLCPPVPEADPPCPEVTVTFDPPVLLSYVGRDRSEPAPVDLPCSDHEIHLRSTDERHRSGYQADQTGEHWFLEGLDATGAVIYTSPAGPDLAEDLSSSSTMVERASLAGVVALRARHVGDTTSANSVEVEAVLVPVP